MKYYALYNQVPRGGLDDYIIDSSTNGVNNEKNWIYEFG